MVNARNIGAVAVAVVALGLAFGVRPAEAQQMVYRPTNPAFGGNPLNQQWLLSTAQAQKPVDKSQASLFNQDPLQDFKTGLQRQILSALSQELVMKRFGNNLDLSKQGRYDLGDFTVDVNPGLNGIDILVTNTLTGEQTTVTVPRM